METSLTPRAQRPETLDDAIDAACARVAPTWPLDRFIAVNPFWGMTDRPITEVASELLARSGARLLMPRAWYRRERAEGRLRDEDLRAALARAGWPTTLGALLHRLSEDDAAPPVRARVVDVVDAGRDLRRALSWREFVVNGLSQFCAAFFDEGQASLGPDREGGLYASWLRHARVDRSPALLMGLRDGRALVDALPTSARAMISEGLAELDVPDDARSAYLSTLLLDLNGWASWCMYRRWTARLDGGDDDQVVDLLAMRLAWERMLLRDGGARLAQRWQLAVADWPRVDRVARAALRDDWILQRAVEIAWQRGACDALSTPAPATPAREVEAQVALCIDVRSEVLRRALEARAPGVQTLGFAGFFGIPGEYLPLGAAQARPQLPGLLAPRVRITDTGVDGRDARARGDRLARALGWRGFKTGAVSTFTFVESLGLSYLAQLFADGFGLSKPGDGDDAGLGPDARARRKPRLTHDASGAPLSARAKGELAAGILRGMSLTRGFAPLVLLLGHGSETRNNPHAAGLDCGACCGQRGDVNARVAAALLNEPEVRIALRESGIDVPEGTRFVAGMHNTTTDEVALFDLDELPETHADALRAMRERLADAGASARVERATRLGMAPAGGASTDAAFRARTRDWAQVRPEWGLANNAAFIAAPRERTLAVDLEGRAFLHEYRADQDEGFAVLEQIMTAPMVVAHWINLQYYASTVDNARYGSGDKALHNVVGGRLGVFEGNGGDLRVGLPMQCLHDGARWVHTPLRLSVFLEAPREAIEAVLAKHPKVRALVEHEWLDLFQIEGSPGAVRAYRGGRWVRGGEDT